jgi:predicted transcriptional regulator
MKKIIITENQIKNIVKKHIDEVTTNQLYYAQRNHNEYQDYVPYDEEYNDSDEIDYSDYSDLDDNIKYNTNIDILDFNPADDEQVQELHNDLLIGCEAYQKYPTEIIKPMQDAGIIHKLKSKEKLWGLTFKGKTFFRDWKMLQKFIIFILDKEDAEISENMKKLIKLTESQLKNVIKKIIEEQYELDELTRDSFRTDENLEGLRNALDKNKVVGVAFVKKDGTVRHMAARKTLSAYVPSEKEKTEKQLMADETYDQKRVVDYNVYKKLRRDAINAGEPIERAMQIAASGCWRKINLKNVLGFIVGGHFIDLREENNIMERYGEEIYNSLTRSMQKALEADVQDAEAEVEQINEQWGDQDYESYNEPTNYDFDDEDDEYDTDIDVLEFNPADDEQVQEFYDLLSMESIKNIYKNYPKSIVKSLEDKKLIQKNPKDNSWTFNIRGRREFRNWKSFQRFLLNIDGLISENKKQKKSIRLTESQLKNIVKQIIEQYTSKLPIRDIPNSQPAWRKENGKLIANWPEPEEFDPYGALEGPDKSLGYFSEKRKRDWNVWADKLGIRTDIIRQNYCSVNKNGIITEPKSKFYNKTWKEFEKQLQITEDEYLVARLACPDVDYVEYGGNIPTQYSPEFFEQGGFYTGGGDIPGVKYPTGSGGPNTRSLRTGELGKAGSPSNGSTNTYNQNKLTYKPATNFPFQYGSKNKAIANVQKWIGLPAKYQTGNFGPITRDSLIKSGYDINNGITLDLYNKLKQNNI